MLYTDFFLFISASVLSYILFYPTILLAWSVGAIDYPSKRKIHRSPTARLGGLCIFIPFSLFILFTSAQIEEKIPLLFGSITIFFVGALDDIVTLSPPAKLSGQICASAVYILSCELTGADVPPISSLLRAAWIIFICNAINLSDGLDGLAASLVASALLCLSVIALILGVYESVPIALLLLFSVLGFLPHNLSRAKIFMGDCGSLFLGSALGVISSQIMEDSSSMLGSVAPILTLCIPLSDTIHSLLRRLANGKSPLKADRGHFHHRLLDLGFSGECAALALICASLFFGLIGIFISALV